MKEVASLFLMLTVWSRASDAAAEVNFPVLTMELRPNSLTRSMASFKNLQDHIWCLANEESARSIE
jgi:hypothetical protein